MKQRQETQQQLNSLPSFNKQTLLTETIKRILIVTADNDVNLALKMALEVHGSYFRVDSINHPLLALEHFKVGFYDLIIIDIVMPKMNGFHLYEEIRKKDYNVKICFLTPGKVQLDAFMESLPGLAPDQFISIPIENEELVDRVNILLES